MTFLSPGRTPVAGFVLSAFAYALASFCGLAAAQTQPGATTLPPVLVSATRFPEDANTLPFGVSVVSAKEIRNAGVSTVNEALMKLLGVPGRLDFYGGGDYALDLRGFGVTAGSNQVVIVDGMRLSEADQGGTRLAGIPIDSIERIEVIRGSSAVLYGEGATAGAIVITTKAASANERRSDARAYMALGSQSLAEARAGLSLSGGGVALDVSGNKRTSDGHRDNFRSSTEGRSSTLQWRNEWLRVGGRHAQDELTTGLPGALSSAEYSVNPRQSTHLTDHASIENQRDSLFGEVTLGNWQIAFDAGNRSKTLLSETVFFGFSSPYDYDIEARSRSVRARHSTSFGSLRNTLVAGVDRYEWTRHVRTYDTHAAQLSKAVYVKDDLMLATGTQLSGGVRTEQAQKTLSGISGTPVDERFNAWEFGVVQGLADKVSVFARLGRSFRFANADEFSFTAPGTILKPQTSRDLDAGARWASGAARAELRYYRNTVRDEIGYDPTMPNGSFFGANTNAIDPIVHQGLELETVRELNAAVELRVNAAWRRARFSSGTYQGNDIALIPSRTLSVGANWQLGGGHKLGAWVNMASSQYPDSANSCRMPSYATVDARYAFQSQAVELAFGVGNVTDKKYYTQAYSCAGGTPTSIYPEAGRSFVASVRVSL